MCDPCGEPRYFLRLKLFCALDKVSIWLQELSSDERSDPIPLRLVTHET